SFVADIPELLRGHILAAENAPAYNVYTRIVAGGTPQSFVRYAQFKSDRVELVRVSYDNAALRVGSPGFAPYRSEEFAAAPRQVLELALPAECPQNTRSRTGAAGIISQWQILALAAYFLIPLWLAWYVYEFDPYSAFFTGTVAALILLGPVLLAIT